MTRCVVVLTDGLRPDAISRSLAPTLCALGDDYARAVRATTVRPSVTVAALASLATGVSPETHGLVQPGLGFLSGLGRLKPLPGELTRHSYRTTVVAGIAGVAARHIGRALCSCAGVGRMITTDPEAGIVAEAAAAQLARPADELLFVYLSDCDRAGHEGGWMSEGYLAAVRRVDGAVGMLTGQLGDATLLVVADHGGGGVHARDHDIAHPLNERIPLIMAGQRVRRRTVVHRDVSLLDVPPTVLAALDLPVPAEYEGRALTEALLARHGDIPMEARVAS
jgi:predicted AlkP superfamily pyrophosphatase or phosphodiesterase